MSGIEVASLVVGVLPLLFATADHFKDACRPFSRYCRLAPELKEFQRQLKTQKTIFRTECSLLLGRTTGPCCAVRMLEGIGSQVQAEGGELDQRFSVHIGEAGEACMAVLKQIEEKLTQMEEDEKELQDAIKSDTPLESIGDARWRRRVGKKLKYSFSKCTNLERNLSTLKELTQNFTTLSTQLERITDQHANTPSASAPKASREVDTYRVVQKASVQLYNALAEACTTHTEHLAHFRLQATHRQHYGKTMSHIRFSMAFKQMPLLDTATPVDPAWFEVESTIEGSIDFDSEAADGSRSSFKPSKRPHVVDKSVSVARRPDDGDDEQDDSYTEFFVAKRLSHTASIQMGPRYSEVVRKCLACDFGQGDDLNQPALQEAFYKDVICELGSLEERFRELQLGVSTDTME
ncbi:MAG: hypothetical protein M1833_003506 [Piccolia ochrophora]|nr:MAG: hypothetical protein M1833_003506 [Piccolia ochrophora]